MGTKPSKRPLHEQLAAKVRKLHAEGLTDATIATRLGCSPSTVGKARKFQGLPAINDRLGSTPKGGGTCAKCGAACSERHSRCEECWSKMSHTERNKAAVELRPGCPEIMSKS